MTVSSQMLDAGLSPEALLAAFAARAESLGVRVERVVDADAAATSIATLAAELGAERPLLAEELREVAPRLVAALAVRGLSAVASSDPAVADGAPLGISLGRLAVAETASVLLAEPTLDDRAIGLLVATQLIVCPTNALVPSLDEAAPALRAVASQSGGGYATLVTGPSRTADIERVLTVGVQGPGRVHVLFIDDLG